MVKHVYAWTPDNVCLNGFAWWELVYNIFNVFIFCEIVVKCKQEKKSKIKLTH